MERLTNFFILSAFISSLFFSYGCKAQTSDSSANKPKIDIKVNKEYDKDGNIIRFDSTYSYSIFSPESSFQFNDSIFNNNFMLLDSLNYNFNSPFFNHDFSNIFNFNLFDEQLKEQMKQFDELIKQFQNIQNNNSNPNNIPEMNNQNNNSSGKKTISL